jgi:hypothetical protein
MGRYNTSDSLAVALTCLGAVMALVLFWIDKTPWTAGFCIAAIAALMVYPVIHFVSHAVARIVVFIVLAVFLAVFGWSIWPKSRYAKPAMAATSPLPSQSQSVEQQQPSDSQQAKPEKPKKSKTATQHGGPPQQQSPPTGAPASPALPAPSNPPISQECQPGANCAQSNNQQEGITAGQLNIGSLPASIAYAVEGQPNRKYQFHDKTLFTTLYRIQVKTSSIPLLTISAAHPKLARVGCTKLKPGTLWGQSESHGAQGGSGSCSIDNAFGNSQLFGVDTTEPVDASEITVTYQCEGVICQ